MNRELGSLPVALLVFFAVMIIVSAFSALFWRSPILILVASIAIFWLVWQRLGVSIRVPWLVLVACLVFFLMASHPFLVIQPGVDASADAAPAVAALVLDEKIPATYGEYSSLKFSYYVGWPLLVREFFDFFSGLPAYAWMWLLSVVMMALQPLLVFLIVRDLHSENTGILASFLFLANKAIFTDFFAGEYPFVAGLTFFLVFVWLYLQQKKTLAFLFFPVIFLVHPATAFLALVFVVVHAFFFGIKRSTFAGLVLGGIILAFPAILVSYSALWESLLSGNAVSASALNPAQLLFLLRTLLFWIGLPLGVAFLSLAVWSRQRTRESTFWVVLLFLSVLGFLFFWATGSLLGPRLVELVAFCAVMLAAFWLARIPDAWLKPAVAVILIAGLALFFSAGYLNEQRVAHRLVSDQAEFSFAFKEAFPQKAKTLFITGREGRGTAKMALIADKIPFDVGVDHFLPLHPNLAGNDPALESIRQKHALSLQIEQGCAECVGQTDAEFVVVKKSVFPFELPYPIVFEFKDYVVYSKANP